MEKLGAGNRTVTFRRSAKSEREREIQRARERETEREKIQDSKHLLSSHSRHDEIAVVLVHSINIKTKQ